MNNYLSLNFSIKAEGDEGEFVAYGNVKNIVDRAGDITVDGCFKASIENHQAKGTMPKMLLQHARTNVIGVWKSMEEDDKGLKMTGQLCLDTQAGKETHALMKMGALDSLSIGYVVNKEKYDAPNNVNLLQEVDVKEVSIVTFPCNEQSRVESVKSVLAKGDQPTERELEKALQDMGFSKRKSRGIVNIGYKQTLDEAYDQHWNICSLLYEVDVNDLEKVEAFLMELIDSESAKRLQVEGQLKELNSLLTNK